MFLDMSRKRTRHRIDVKESEVEAVKDFLSHHRALQDECEQVGIPLESVNHYWYKGQNFSIHAKGETFDLQSWGEDIIKEVKKHAPTYKKIKRTNSKNARLLVISPADVHIGKLSSAFETGKEYNQEIAIKRALDGVKGILNEVGDKKIDQILFIAGNDILHTDTTKRTTTSGTPQDTDGSWFENYMKAQKLYIDILEMLVTVADVHFLHTMSNHDFMSGFFLAQSIEAFFSGNKNITFDCSPKPRKYYRYHNCLLGFSHGDGNKTADIPNLMAIEAKEDWSKVDHRWFFTGHIHHKQAKDFIGVCWESLRSPSESDSWHQKKGYTGAPKAIEGFLFHKQYGQTNRISYFF